MEPGRRVRARTILTDDQRHILTEAFKAGLTSTGKPKLREIEGLAQQLHLSVSTVIDNYLTARDWQRDVCLGHSALLPAVNY